MVFHGWGGQIALRFHDEGSGELGAEDLTNRYFWGPAVDQILADEQVHWEAGQQEYVTDELLWPLGDQLGSVRDVIDGSGTVKIHRVYDAFGNFTEDPATASHLFAFTARPFDAATGLQNNLNRWYDGQVGRWLSEDPIGFYAGDENLYRYVANRPETATDPTAEASHHPYPLHLGGRMGQPVLNLNKTQHLRAAAYLRGFGFGPGEAGRAAWARLTLRQQQAHIMRNSGDTQLIIDRMWRSC